MLTSATLNPARDDNWYWGQPAREGLWGVTAHVRKRVYTYDFGSLSKCGYTLVWWEFIVSEHPWAVLCSVMTQQKSK